MAKDVILTIKQYNDGVKNFCKIDNSFNYELMKLVVQRALYCLEGADEAEEDRLPCKALSFTAEAFELIRLFMAGEPLQVVDFDSKPHKVEIMTGIDLGFDTAYLDPDRGSDDKAILGSHDRPFATLEAAKSARKDGRSLIVRINSAMVAYLDNEGKPQMENELDAAYMAYCNIRALRKPTS